MHNPEKQLLFKPGREKGRDLPLLKIEISQYFLGIMLTPNIFVLINDSEFLMSTKTTI